MKKTYTYKFIIVDTNNCIKLRYKTAKNIKRTNLYKSLIQKLDNEQIKQFSFRPLI